MIALDKILAHADTLERELPALLPQLTIPSAVGLAQKIDHTLLKPEATAEQIKKLCTEAKQYSFAAVCVNPIYVSLAKSLLADTRVHICAVVAFPLGATLPELKVHETRTVIKKGASEVDMVMNIGALKGEAYALVLNDILAVAQEAHDSGAMLKVIIEAALLTRREKILACLFSRTAGADCVKTSTGFGPGGATVEDVALMRYVVGPDCGVKAAGGIRTLKVALAMIAAGADRLGTSAGVSILQEAMQQGAIS